MSKNENGKLCAILAYFLIGIIWYFVDDKMKKDAFAKFHAKQALFLLIISLVVSVALSLLAGIPFLGWVIGLLLGFFLNLVIFILWIFGLVYAAKGEKKKIPIIGGFAEKVLTF